MLNNKIYYAVIHKYLTDYKDTETLFRTRELARKHRKSIIDSYQYSVVKVKINISWKQ